MKILNQEEIDLRKIKKYQEIPPEILDGVKTIIEEVSRKGDAALIKYTEKFDQCRLPSIRVNIKEEMSRINLIDSEIKRALRLAVKNVRQAARKQKSFLQKAINYSEQIIPGVHLKHRTVPVKRAGIYVPGGRYPLISSFYMGVIPAREAGV
ncbi:MAG: histidinol dehydrogenase, partial [Candidatus Saccharicenans sp.]